MLEFCCFYSSCRMSKRPPRRELCCNTHETYCFVDIDCVCVCVCVVLSATAYRNCDTNRDPIQSPATTMAAASATKATRKLREDLLYSLHRLDEQRSATTLLQRAASLTVDQPEAVQVFVHTVFTATAQSGFAKRVWKLDTYLIWQPLTSPNHHHRNAHTWHRPLHTPAHQSATCCSPPPTSCGSSTTCAVLQGTVTRTHGRLQQLRLPK